MMDALNECSETDVPDLVRGAQSFALEFGARIILTSQTNIELPADLKVILKQLPPPDTLQKRLIYCHHADLTATSEIDVFCAGFTNAYDLTLAESLLQPIDAQSPELRFTTDMFGDASPNISPSALPFVK